MWTSTIRRAAKSIICLSGAGLHLVRDALVHIYSSLSGMFSEFVPVSTRGAGEQASGRGGGRFEARVADVDLAARARLVRLRGADDAGAPRHLSCFFPSSCGGALESLGWVCSLHSLRQAKNCGEVSEEYWLAVKAARSPKNRPLAPNERSKALGVLLASVSQYASPSWLPNL